MSETPLVSVVVVSYNNWPDLELAVESALCQTYKPIEVIVVDNSSTDATARELPARFGDRIKIARQPNSGDAGAYNTGMGLARGEFVQFLDGDDVLAPYKIQKQMEVFRQDPAADVVYGDARPFQELEGTMTVKDITTREEHDLLAAFLASRGDYFGNTVCLLLRRRALERVGAWDETVYVTDTDYWLRALWAGCRFRPCPGALMGFIRLGPCKMSSNVAKMLRGHEALWLKASGYVDRPPYEDLVLRNLAHTRYLRAIRGDGLTVAESLVKLSQSRAVGPLALALGIAAVLLPGGRALVRSPRWRALRRLAARLAAFPLS